MDLNELGVWLAIILGLITIPFAFKKKWAWVTWIGILATLSWPICAAISYATKPPPSPPFNVTTQFNYINLSQSLQDVHNGGSGLFWVTYTYPAASGTSQTAASPVGLMLHTDITNLTTSTQTIASYSLLMKIDECGDWIKLIPIPAQGTNVWFTYVGLYDAKPFDFSSDSIDNFLTNPIPTGQTISGWWLWGSPEACAVNSESMVQYHISLKTFSGIDYETTTSPELITRRGNAVNNYEMGNYTTSTDWETRIPYLIVPPASGRTPINIDELDKRIYTLP